jgi:hypothetical protein
LGAVRVGRASQVDERAEDRLGALLNLYGSLAHAPALQRHALLAAADYARKCVIHSNTSSAVQAHMPLAA